MEIKETAKNIGAWILWILVGAVIFSMLFDTETEDRMYEIENDIDEMKDKINDIGNKIESIESSMEEAPNYEKLYRAAVTRYETAENFGLECMSARVPKKDCINYA
ncbi:MAG: hypothetical protein V1914_00650 [archaeon]